MGNPERQLEKVKVSNHSDILTALKPFLDDKHQLRQSLLDGFNLVKNRTLFNEQVNSGLDVDKMHIWVDTMVRDRLDGRREGFFVVWEIPEGDKKVKYKFDPYSKKLTKEE
jgi:hypothetical protein